MAQRLPQSPAGNSWTPNSSLIASATTAAGRPSGASAALSASQPTVSWAFVPDFMLGPHFRDRGARPDARPRPSGDRFPATAETLASAGRGCNLVETWGPSRLERGEGGSRLRRKVRRPEDCTRTASAIDFRRPGRRVTLQKALRGRREVCRGRELADRITGSTGKKSHPGNPGDPVQESPLRPWRLD